MTFAELAEILHRELGADADRVLTLICHECAGESLYIPRRARRPEILPHDTPQTLQARYQVSRATAYSWVNNWRR
ncbi:hypothetical protein MARPU_09565 [Marichromatium purpuratum 984]|uniref:Helix-turn-helix domain-containing protein n=1 Tax=Marichromatium purpuratum 984 TaxID=765910 RepID=W0E434_MARPU|nr:hypothetical protein [Marichromatium purpuratum]AHF05512.1 hypothetical protein MARPU_09565 [Marichromatium purpuratum 984]